MAVQFVVSAAKRELSQPKTIPASKPTSPSKFAPQRERKSSSSQFPLLLRNRRRSSGKGVDEDVDPELQLARNLGISLTADAVPDNLGIDTLERTLLERIGKLEKHASTLQSTTETSISSHLMDAHMTLELLHDSLLAESLYHKVRLLDPTLEEPVASFEHELRGLRQNIEAVDLHTLQSRNVYKEEFVKRWSK